MHTRGGGLVAGEEMHTLMDDCFAPESRSRTAVTEYE